MKQIASGDLLLCDVTLKFGRCAVCLNWNERYVCGEPECLPRNGSAADD
ncbi:hypothetical protein T03_6522 [Trichinella britovi]|uniref:Uncharacterized protein n=1 Tax=Trichinella britovi TaxID=45882 RepID=A0A0V0YSU5_TRIBR|nr:hypothetical protein T03_6522 [Trichinella britovi]